MLKIKVKAGSITNLTDARYFAAREVEWLGFPVGMGEGMIPPLETKAIAEWVDGVKIVGEFGFATPEEILVLNEQVGFDAVQVGMFVSQKEISELNGLAVIKEVVVDSNFSAIELEDHMNAYSYYCDLFLLNFSSAGHTWDDLKNEYPYKNEFLRGLCEKYQIILHLDCPAIDVAEMIAEINPHGIQLNGGEEERVGVKSFDELDEIIDALEID